MGAGDRQGLGTHRPGGPAAHGRREAARWPGTADRARCDRATSWTATFPEREAPRHHAIRSGWAALANPALASADRRRSGIRTTAGGGSLALRRGRRRPRGRCVSTSATTCRPGLGCAEALDLGARSTRRRRYRLDLVHAALAPDAPIADLAVAYRRSFGYAPSLAADAPGTGRGRVPPGDPADAPPVPRRRRASPDPDAGPGRGRIEHPDRPAVGVPHRLRHGSWRDAGPRLRAPDGVAGRRPRIEQRTSAARTPLVVLTTAPWPGASGSTTTRRPADPRGR